MILRCLLAIVLAALSFDGRAAAWLDLRYDQGIGADALLDIHAPSAAGPHRVLLWLHGGDWRTGDKSLQEQQIARFNARGFVVVSADYPAAPARHPAQIEHAAAALAWVVRNIARFGGDPARIQLMGVDAGAHLSALLVADPQWLARYQLSPAAVQGAVLIRADSLDLVSHMQTMRPDAQDARRQVFGNDPALWLAASPLGQLRAGVGTPPILLVDRRDSLQVPALQRERFGDRLRGIGVANQIFLLPEHAQSQQAARSAEFGETGQDAIFAWLDALALPRVARFENLQFDTDFVSGLDRDTALRGAEVGFMLPFDGRLWASLSDADARSNTVARLLSKSSADAEWVEAQAFSRGQQFTALSAWELDNDDAGQAIPAAKVMIAGLVTPRGASQWQWSRGEDRFQMIADHPQQALTATAVHHDSVSGADVILLGSAGGGIRAAAWQQQSSSLRLHASAELDGADVTAIAIANRVAYAAVKGSNAGLYQRIDGLAPRWQRITDTEVVGLDRGEVTAMSAVADPAGAGHEVLLLAHAQSGRVVRIDPQNGFGRSLEVDLGAAFAEVWKGNQRAVDFGGNAFVALTHPETADQVHAIGLRVRHPLAGQAPHNGAWYVLRQSDASYSYGMSYDYRNPPSPGVSLGSVRAVAASPFVNDRAGAVYFAGFDAEAGDRDSGWIQRGKMAVVAPSRGLWWDRSHSGHGLDLQAVGSNWMLTFSTYDEAGQPVWYAANGVIANARFTTESGLVRYRYALDRDPPQQRNAARSGEVSIRFGLDHGEGACADSARDRADAIALAELSVRLDGRDLRWCIEPMRFADAGVPTANANGLWYAGPADAGWGVSITERGVDGRSLGVVHVFYYNADGEPRWALGTAPVVDGNARYTLRSFSGYCPGCARKEITSEAVGEFTQRLSGFCGAVNGFGSVDIRTPEDGAGMFARSRFPMNRVSSAACY